jgi:membrane complex biogenesis BtpA family protein
MVHLLPLLGSPGYSGEPSGALERALADAQALAGAGFAGVGVENYGDLPFEAEKISRITLAAMTRIVAAIRERCPQLKIAINCLRNDARSALAIATATGSDAIRVNVHSGAAVTDQGVIEGRAARTLRLRRQWGGEIRILADLRVKHAAPLAPRALVEEALDLRERGLADAILITGSGTGRPADLAGVEELREGLPGVPLFVASGVSSESAGEWARRVDGAIVGTDIMVDGRAGAGIDPVRARRFLSAWLAAASL